MTALVTATAVAVVPPSAQAEIREGATDWIFPSRYVDGYTYTAPENVLRRDGATAYSQYGGLITLRDFAPVDLPVGTFIDKVELRFDMAGEHASAQFTQSFPSYVPCQDHTHPGYLKDFVPLASGVPSAEMIWPRSRE
ncbi:hypothetical protein AB0G02_41155, partial [Actinosynnema sp. NPDC023658]|uniref:hypothetical protein n=1 Tax=Actinosynnema sp. NPDC023658 TaxID=3155465 RepID=UPI0033C8B509